MNRSVRELIKEAEGPDAISLASQETRYPVGPDAVAKWRRNGIPDVHWPIFIRKARATADEIYQANEQLRELQSGGIENARRKSSVAA